MSGDAGVTGPIRRGGRYGTPCFPGPGQQTGSNHLWEKPKKARENGEELWICSGVHSGVTVLNYIGVIRRGI